MLLSRGALPLQHKWLFIILSNRLLPLLYINIISCLINQHYDSFTSLELFEENWAATQFFPIVKSCIFIVICFILRSQKHVALLLNVEKSSDPQWGKLSL